MEHKASLSLAKRVTPHLLMCIGGVLGFILLAIYPTQKSLADLDGEIKKLEAQMELQETLAPVYRGFLEKVNVKEPGILPYPQKAKLEGDKVGEISSVFIEKAKNSSLELVNVVPDVKSLVGASGRLSVSALMKGSFFNFRNFLIQIGQIPYLEHIEEIQIQPVEGAKEFRIKVWLVLNR